MKRRPVSAAAGDPRKESTLRRLDQTLEREEQKQLRSFLRQRSQAVDEEIRRLTTKLRGPSTEKDLDALLTKLRPPMAGVSKVNPIATPLMASAPLKLAGPPLEMQGVSISIQPRTSTEQLDAPSDIKRLISKFKTCLRQSDLSAEDFHQICFPPGITGAYESTMPLSEFIDILNIDLMLSLSMREQQTLLSSYGILDENGSRSNILDIKAFLVDADAWPSGEVTKKETMTTLVSKGVDYEYELEANTKANIEALRSIHDLVNTSVRNKGAITVQRYEKLNEQRESPHARIDGLGQSLSSDFNSFALERGMDGPEPLPPTQAMSSALLNGEDVYRELQELRERYAALEARQSPSVARPETITEGETSNRGGGRGRASGGFVREGLRELDRGTFFSRPELRRHGFSPSMENPQLAYETWTHPSKGARSTIPSLTSVMSRSFAPNETADAYNPALDKDEISISKLCEQSIISKLLRLPEPQHSLDLLTGRILERGMSSEFAGYITCPQLQLDMKSVGLRIDDKELEVFSAGSRFSSFGEGLHIRSLGFGSNGKGGVSAAEVSEALRSLYFASTAGMKEANSSKRTSTALEALDEEAKAILRRVAAAVILATSTEYQE